MLSLALLIAAVIAVNDVSGRALLNLSAPGHTPTFIPRYLTGTSLTTALAAALSLILPLGVTALGLLVLPALALVLWQARSLAIPRLSMPAPAWALLVLFLLAVLHNAALPVSNFDTGLYHAQAIQWLEKFPAVPGLANLHGRLGFNSNWFVANAWSGLGFLNLADFRPASPALFLALLGGMLAQLSKITAQQPGRIAGILLIPAAFYALGSELSSPGTDLPAALLTWACLWLLLAEPESPLVWLTLAVTPVFAMTVKLSTAPLLLFSLYALYKLRHPSHRRALAAALVVIAGILLPWLMRNVILTGYLLYPQTALDLFRVDWKVPLDAVAAESDAVLAWGRLPGQPVDETLALPLTAWLPQWFDNLSRGQQALVTASALAPLVTLWYAWRTPAMREKVIIVTLGLYLGWMYWLTSAPAIRFGYGYTLGLVALAAACILAWLAERITMVRRSLPTLMGLLIGAYLILFFVQSFNPRILNEFALLPAPYPSLPTAPCQIQNATIFIGQEYQQCWDAPIPCAPSCNPNLALRGSSLAEGFYIP